MSTGQTQQFRPGKDQQNRRVGKNRLKQLASESGSDVTTAPGESMQSTQLRMHADGSSKPGYRFNNDRTWRHAHWS
jgi:hypothetical protein